LLSARGQLHCCVCVGGCVCMFSVSVEEPGPSASLWAVNASAVLKRIRLVLKYPTVMG